MSTNTADESFHPLGEEWESQLTAMLDETEYDTELGLDMARDAQRLVAGELTEAEFHEKYHEQVLAEFGEDERPTAEAYEEAQAADGGGLLDAIASLGEGDSEQGRREVMKKMGAGGAFLGLGALATAEDHVGDDGIASASHDGHEGVQWGMTIDLEVCDGCLTCVTACSEENNLDQGVNWMYVLAYEDDTVSVPDDPGIRDYPYLVRPCQHCTDAPCEKVCPTTARHTRAKDGLVLTDYDICIGCRYCQVACPYGVNYFQWGEPDVSEGAIAAQSEEMGHDGDHIRDERGRRVDSRAPRGVMSKCTFCPTRQDGYMGDDMVGTTACMQACPPGAIQFGDVNDPSSDASIYAEYPALGRAIEHLFGTARNVPSVDDVEAELDDAEIQDVVDTFEVDYGDLSALVSIVVLTDEIEYDEDSPRIRSFAADIEDARELVAAFEDAGIDFEDDEVRSVLRLGDMEVDDAETALESAYGTAESSFKLLEEIGTNPNINYIGHEPGPSAEQVDHYIAYADLTYERADGSQPNLMDNLMDRVDRSTVRGR